MMNEKHSTGTDDFRSRITLDSFPHPASHFSVVETHISLVFLTESRVYKTKKPVRFPFLDYSSIEKRLDACREEVRVNRRLAPHVYLGVIPMTRDRHIVRFGGEGQVIDYAVEMMRLPEDDLLDHRIAAGSACVADVTRLLDLLIPFYKQHPCEEQLRPCASHEAVWNSANENVQTMSPLVPGEFQTLLARLRSSQLQFIEWHHDQFNLRMNSEDIVEGHGDLRPEHICMTDPPVVFDAVEFSRELRTADVASELAFLAMEFDFLNAHHLGRELIEQFQFRSNKHFPMQLFSFYQAYRATVRAKVHSFQMASNRSDSNAHHAWFHRYLHLAAAYASDFHQPVIVITMGLSGVGKSTLARELSLRWGAEWVRTDQVRQEFAERREPDAPFGQGMYGDQMTMRTYQELANRAKELLRQGISVVLDGTFIETSQRALIDRVGGEEDCPIFPVWCDCPESLVRKRIVERSRKGDDISDAGLNIYEHQLANFNEASLLNDPRIIRVDTSLPATGTIEHVVAAIRSRFPHWV